MTWQVVPWGGAVRGVANAGQSWPRRDGLLLVLEGACLGEATPLPGFCDDSLERARAALGSLPAPVDDVDAVEALARELASPSARFALETALLDRIARRRGVALSRLLGAKVDGVPRSVLVGTMSDPGMLDNAQRAVTRGARTLKLKATGRDLDEESRRLTELRSRVGPDVALRLDLNGSLDAPAAREALVTYARHGVELCEEPAAGAELRKLGAEATPWLTDESALGDDAFEAFLSHPSCAGFVLKPTCTGGLLPALRRARRALASGKRAIVSHAFEGPVALAAAAALALALGEDAHGVDTHPALVAFPAAELSALPERAPLRVVAPPRPGLGLRFEEPWPSR